MARDAAPRGAARKRLPTVAEVRRMINVVPDAGVKKFLACELLADGARRGRFEALARRSEFNARGEDYHARVTEMLDRGSGGGFISHHTPYISIADVKRDARARERIGDYEEAARIYGQTAEAVIDYLPRIFSVAGRFRDQAGRCIRAVGECAKKSDDGRARMRMVQYLVDRMLDDTETLWLDDYWAALEGACPARDDRLTLLEMIERCLSAGPPADLGKDDRDGWGKYVRVFADELREEIEGGRGG